MANPSRDQLNQELLSSYQAAGDIRINGRLLRRVEVDGNAVRVWLSTADTPDYVFVNAPFLVEDPAGDIELEVPDQEGLVLKHFREDPLGAVLAAIEDHEARQ